MSYSESKLKRKKERGVIYSFVAPFEIGIISFVVMLSVFSLITLNVHFASEYLFIFVLIASGLSSLIGSVSSCFFVSAKRLVFGMTISSMLAISEFLILLCFNNVSLSNIVYLLFPIVIAMGFIGCIIGTNIKKK